MTQPAEIEALAAALVADLVAVNGQILAELDALAGTWFELTPPARVRRLKTLQTHLMALLDQADAIAARSVAQTMQGAYEIGAWATAIPAGAGAVFAAVDVDAVTALAQDTMANLLNATTGVRQDVKDLIRELTRDQVRAKLLTGQTATQAGKDLAKTLADRGVTAVVYADGRRVTLPTYAEMVVRTKTAEAYQEGGLNQGERLEIDWWEILDGPGCGWSSHNDPQAANGMIVSLSMAREHPLSHPNCVMPDTVSGFYGGATQLVRARYDGPAHTLTWRTPAGLHTATVGPNHPVLTATGWKAAHLIHEGEQLVHDTHAPHPVSGDAAEPDLEEVPPTIEESFEAFRALGAHSRVAATSDDLHGDAVFGDGEIDVVDVDRVLLGEGDPSFLEHPFEGDLVWTDVVPVGEVRAGTLEHLVAGPVVPADRGVRGRGAAEALLRGGTLGPESVALADRAGQAMAAQTGADAGRGEAGDVGDLGGGHSLGDVEVDEGVERDALGGHRFLLAEIVSIEVGRFCGWVYDSSTAGGAFTANGAVVKNCRRSSSPRPDIRSMWDAANADPTPTGDVTGVWAQAVAAQQDAQRATALSDTAARASTGLDVGAGTIPNTAAGRRFAATLRKHTA